MGRKLKQHAHNASIYFQIFDEDIGFLMLYRIDAQNIALNENDLEDTEWLPIKKLKKLKEFTVTNWDSVENKGDGIVIGAEKKGKELEIITTSQLHALIVGTTGSGKTTGFVDQNISVLSRSKGKPKLLGQYQRGKPCVE